MAKQLLTPLRLIARMNISLKNYSCELFNLTGTVGKVELISTCTTAVCESWNVSDKYTWDNAGDHKQLSMARLSVRIIGVIKRQFFHMITHVFDNSSVSQEIFAIDTWGSCNMLFATWSQAHAYDPSDHMENREGRLVCK